MKLGNLAQQFPGLFISRLGGLDSDLDDLIAALPAALVQNALFPQAETLAVLGALRDLQQGAAVDGRHFDFGAKRSLPDRDRHSDFDVVAFAMEERMIFD